MLQRMLIDKIENRILVGIVAFVGVMILVGWVAINEGARMSSFERQFEARSIERGAELFAANCSTCHGAEGLGINGRAPALNSPHLFGYDYFAEINNEIDRLQERDAELEAELGAMMDEIRAGVSDERRAEILERQTEISEERDSIATQLADLETQKQDLIVALQPAIDNGYPITTQLTADGESVTVIQPSRLAQLGWSNTLESFILTTLIHGRPTSIGYWPQPMVAWEQTAGGPLRRDQIQDITNYILNWDKGNDWTLEDALRVQQYGIVPGLGGGGGEQVPPVGVDVDAILQRLEEQNIVGDPVRGGQIYTNAATSQLGRRLGCSGCHMGGVAAPNTEETWDAILNERLNDPALAGYTPERYLVESIVQPGNYVVPGWPAGQMPANFGEQMSLQDIADVIVYLRSYSDSEVGSWLEGTGEAAPADDTENSEESSGE
ncbi:MAG: hypothetical protein Kow00117_23700 [Phototrophicales bacterium]